MPGFRPLVASDQARLWDWLHAALWDPPPAPLRPRTILDSPAVRIYAQEWGRVGDVGVVAMENGAAIGACWLRLLPDGLGLAWVDAATPQLGIALEPRFRHRGIGKLLLLNALAAAWTDGYAQVSLTVHPENPARRMYAACGFLDAGRRGAYQLMVARRGG